MDGQLNSDLNGALYGQTAAMSYTHSMRAPWETAEEASAHTMQFISDSERKASLSQKAFTESGGAGFSPLALYMFGQALHPITDGTSPTHEGTQVWMGIVPAKEIAYLVVTGNTAPLEFFIAMDLAHTAGENRATFLPRKEMIIAKAQESFGATFGPELLKRATRNAGGYTSLDLLHLISGRGRMITGRDFGVVTITASRNSKIGRVLSGQ